MPDLMEDMVYRLINTIDIEFVLDHIALNSTVEQHRFAVSGELNKNSVIIF